MKMTDEGGGAEGIKRANKMISRVAEEVMLSIFGRKSLDNIIQIMKERYGLDLDEMPDKPRLFSEAMREIVGVSSVIIEDLIIENLYMKVGLEICWKKGYSFPDYINEVKNFILSDGGGRLNGKE
jgi:hypothetical protein